MSAPAQEIAVIQPLQGYTFSSGWQHPLEVMATPSAGKGVALSAGRFTNPGD